MPPPLPYRQRSATASWTLRKRSNPQHTSLIIALVALSAVCFALIGVLVIVYIKKRRLAPSKTKPSPRNSRHTTCQDTWKQSKNSLFTLDSETGTHVDGTEPTKDPGGLSVLPTYYPAPVQLSSFILGSQSPRSCPLPEVAHERNAPLGPDAAASVPSPAQNRLSLNLPSTNSLIAELHNTLDSLSHSLELEIKEHKNSTASSQESRSFREGSSMKGVRATPATKVTLPCSKSAPLLPSRRHRGVEAPGLTPFSEKRPDLMSASHISLLSATTPSSSSLSSVAVLGHPRQITPRPGDQMKNLPPHVYAKWDRELCDVDHAHDLGMISLPSLQESLSPIGRTEDGRASYPAAGGNATGAHVVSEADTTVSPVNSTKDGTPHPGTPRGTSPEMEMHQSTLPALQTTLSTSDLPVTPKQKVVDNHDLSFPSILAIKKLALSSPDLHSTPEFFFRGLRSPTGQFDFDNMISASPQTTTNDNCSIDWVGGSETFARSREMSLNSIGGAYSEAGIQSFQTDPENTPGVLCANLSPPGSILFNFPTPGPSLFFPPGSAATLQESGWGGSNGSTPLGNPDDVPESEVVALSNACEAHPLPKVVGLGLGVIGDPPSIASVFCRMEETKVDGVDESGEEATCSPENAIDWNQSNNSEEESCRTSQLDSPITLLDTTAKLDSPLPIVSNLATPAVIFSVPQPLEWCFVTSESRPASLDLSQLHNPVLDDELGDCLQPMCHLPSLPLVVVTSPSFGTEDSWDLNGLAASFSDGEIGMVAPDNQVDTTDDSTSEYEGDSEGEVCSGMRAVTLHQAPRSSESFETTIWHVDSRFSEQCSDLEQDEEQDVSPTESNSSRDCSFSSNSSSSASSIRRLPFATRRVLPAMKSGEKRQPRFTYQPVFDVTSHTSLIPRYKHRLSIASGSGGEDMPSDSDRAPRTPIESSPPQTIPVCQPRANSNPSKAYGLLSPILGISLDGNDSLLNQTFPDGVLLRFDNEVF